VVLRAETLDTIAMAELASDARRFEETPAIHLASNVKLAAAFYATGLASALLEYERARQALVITPS